jgi:eukaryotic translation initiation factor 2C
LADISPPAASQSCSGASSVVNVSATSIQPLIWTDFEQDMRSLRLSVQSKIGRDLEMVLAILPTSAADIYGTIKSFGDVHTGVCGLT